MIASGESLGAYGSQAAFLDGRDLQQRVDGAIWTGSPQASKLLREFTQARHRGSPQIAPVYDNGLHIRFVNEPSQLQADLSGRELGRWEFPRAVFVQHASEPVVWYDTRLMIEKPDWIGESAGLDVLPMRFFPFATYLKILVDLPIAGTAPAGHGHTYHREVLDAWMCVLGFDQPQALGRLGSTAWVDPQMKARIGDAIDTDNLRDP